MNAQPFAPPPPRTACEERAVSARVPAAALAPGLLLALALWAGEAAAQNVCRGGPYTGADGGNIRCDELSGSNDIVIDPESVNVARLHANHQGSGDITIRMTAGTLTGFENYSILAERRGSGDASIEVSGGSLADTVLGSTGSTATGDVSISMSGGTLSGRLAISRNGGTGNAYVTVSGDATIKETRNGVLGAGAVSNGLGDELSVRVMGGSVETTGADSAGLFLRSSNNNGAAAAAMTAVIEGGSVRTRGSRSSGVWFTSFRGSRDASFRMTGGSVVVEADDSAGVYFWLNRFAAGQTASVRMTGGSIVVEGLGSRGLSAPTLNLGSLDAMTGAGAEIAVPFAVGMEGLLEVDASATGRLVFAHGGAVEAREVGVLARAARSSGHTMGAGATTADDAARTMPMIHVTSSGDITVGAPVTDAFIRNRIAGADETLSAAEQAVLSAITAGDSDALTTALAALSDDDYDADWKAEAQDLLRKRAASSAAPAGDGPLAQRAGEEILGLSRAGIRAVALSHTAIVDHVRAGDALSDAERAVLAAVLTKGTGSELETALTALTGAAYTTAWKDTVRRFAATYNAGDIRVDVTGGSIAAEGNGVEALYAVQHDSNGAIAVTVAEGARITGGANGLLVRGGGAGEGGLRAQSVAVDGRVTGGSGAGVHLAGGGRLTVGRTGRIGATSGVGVLSDGGDLTATVSGTVEGDVQVLGGGALRLNVMEGGAVTGTVRDPVGLSVLAGSIGRLLYTNGATVTVAATGALTGVEVEGGTEAIRSEAGDLDLTVAGRVAGDLRAPSGGALRLAVAEGGVVTGTVHDPVGLPVLAGSIGRLLYSGGATVAVAATGALTGVEVEGGTEALRAEAGDLAVTVAGRVRGDIVAAGDLRAAVAGRVEGDVRVTGTGALTLALAEGGAVTGTVHDPLGPLTVVGSIGRLLYAGGATVTVAPTGALTGVEVEGGTEALRSEGGDLAVMVAGRVSGDIVGLGAGDHLVAVAEGGAVTGTVHLAASTVRVDGAVGRVRFDNGGQVTVGRSGRLTGIEGVAIRNEGGALRVVSAGRIEGDVVDVGERPAAVTVEAGGTVTGSIDLSAEGSAVTVEGTAGRVLLDGGGTVTVGGSGRLTGIEDRAIASARGDLEVEIRQAPGETAEQVRDRIQGTMRDADGAPEVRYIFADGRRIDGLGAPGSAASAPVGAYDVGVVADGDGVRMAYAFAPRARVYEALPSVLLGVNGLAMERRPARSPNGAWGEVEASRASWDADRTTTGASWDARRSGFRTGLDVAAGDGWSLGVSVHHRRARADVARGGRVEAEGSGFGLSAGLERDGFQVNARAQASWYSVDLSSSVRGALASGLSVRGWALGLEAGRRLSLSGGGVEGLSLVPRVGLAHSQLSLGAFTDAVGARVSPGTMRSLRGRAGVGVEFEAAAGGVLFGTLDVEREFRRRTRVTVSGTPLEARSEASVVRVGVGGERGWDGDRTTLRGTVSYATGGGDDYGGSLALIVRF